MAVVSRLKTSETSFFRKSKSLYKNLKDNFGISRTAPPSPTGSLKSLQKTSVSDMTRRARDTSTIDSTTTGSLCSSTMHKSDTSDELDQVNDKFRKTSLGCDKMNSKKKSISSNSRGCNSAPIHVNNKSTLKFQKIFTITEDERLIKSFSCALVDDMLFQGTFYVSKNYFCFYTKIANRRKLIKVPVKDVMNITREKTAGIIPNAIAIHTKVNRYLFTSFVLRDSTYKFMLEIWDTRRSESNTLAWISECATATIPIPSALSSVTISSSLGASLPSLASVAPTSLSQQGPSDISLSSSSTPLTSSTVGSISCHGSPLTTSTPVTAIPGTHSHVIIGKRNNVKYRAPLPNKKITEDSINVTNEDSCAPTGFSDLSRFSRNEIFLISAYIILFILTCCAVMFAWRVHNFQQILLDRVHHLQHVSTSSQEAHHSPISLTSTTSFNSPADPIDSSSSKHDSSL